MIQNGLVWGTISTLLLIVAAQAAVHRERRDLFQLEEVIYDGTGLNALTYLNGYGCYCGWGGSGAPIDGIDHCCMIHDNCYGNVTAKSHNQCTPKWMHYKFSVYKDQKGPIHNIIKCLDKDDPKFVKSEGFNNDQYCHHQICLCDKGLTECVEKYSKVYMKQPKQYCKQP